MLIKSNDPIKLEEYQKAIEINPKNADTYYNMGNAYSNLKEYDKAITAYQKAIEINPKNDSAYNNMGVAYDELKEYDKAIIAYQKAIEINPKLDVAYYNIGFAYANLKAYDKAIIFYQKAIEINLKDYMSYINLFELQLTLNQYFSLEKPFLLHFGDDKKVMMYYEMLRILRSIATNSSYGITVELWSEKYRDIELDCGWDEINRWLENMPDGEIKAELVEAIEVFKAH